MCDVSSICGRHDEASIRKHLGRLPWRRTTMRYECDLCPYLDLLRAERMNAADCFYTNVYEDD